MRTSILIAIAFSFCGGVAQAQEVVLRSGDHPTFSRVTVPFPVSQPWIARQTSSGVEVSFSGFAGRLDTAGVFERMRRNRISEVSQDGGVLVLAVTCECIATVFRSGGLLVIDVADQGTVLAGPPLDRTITASETTKKTQWNIMNQPYRSSLPWIGSESPFSTSTVESSSQNDSREGNSAELDERKRSEERTVLLNQIQQSLLKEIASAASAGLLAPSNSIPVERPLVADTLVINKPEQPEKLPIDLNSTSRNLRISNSMDSQVGFRENQINATPSGISCPDDSFLSVENWSDNSSFSAQVGPARSALTDARDRLDLDAVQNLAQIYIYFGFGAEGYNTLQLEPPLMEKLRHIADVSRILEYGSISRPNTLSQFTDCASNVALWASLSFDEIPSDALVNVDATLRALNKLPDHLRQLVAPNLSSRLLQYGDPAAAAMAMRSVERLPGILPPISLLAQANLAISAGLPADAFLEEVIDANTEESPNALIKLVKNHLADDEKLSDETAMLVEAYAQELRGTEVGNQLRQTQVIALSKAGRFKEAFEKMNEIVPSISPAVAHILTKTIFEQLHQKANDLVFLEHVLSSNANTIDALPSSIHLSLAERLLDLGFPAQGQEILTKIPETPRLPERQILTARAALLLLQPFHAQAALIGVEGKEADLLLAKAKEMTGAFREASIIFSNRNAPIEAAQAAFLSEGWRDLIPADNLGFGAVASIAQTSIDNSDLGTLGQANRELEESARARDALEALLNDITLQIKSDF